MNRLFVRLSAPAHQTDEETWSIGRLSWVLLDGAGELISQGQGDSGALGRLLERRADETMGVVLLVPTEHTMLAELTVPGRSAGQMRRALPFVLEEYVATEIDDMHLAHGQLQRGAPVRCVGVERGLVAQWLAALNPLDMRPMAMVPEASLLPAEANTLNVLFDEEDVLIAGAAQAAVVDAELTLVALSTAVSELTPEIDATVRLINGQLPELDRSQVEQHFDGGLSWVDDDTEVPALVYLARRWLADPAPLNLLHGEFAPPREIDPNWLKLRPVAALVGILFILAVAVEAGKAVWADHRAGGLKDETVALYKQYFPRERRVVDPYRQMSQHIGQTEGEGASFLALLGHLSAELSSAGPVEMRSIAFNAGRGELSAEVTIARFEALDALKDALAARGLDVEIASAEAQEDGDGVRARLRLGSG